MVRDAIELDQGEIWACVLFFVQRLLSMRECR